MTVDASRPRDTQDVIASLGAYIREDREEINALWAALVGLGTVVQDVEVEMSGGETELEVGVDLSPAKVETIQLSGSAGGIELEMITKALSGSIKIIIFTDTNVRIKNDAAKFRLSQPAQVEYYGGVVGDTIILANVGGDGESDDGYWREISRSQAAQ